MRAHIDHTVEVTEEQRVHLAVVLDGIGSTKRLATRDEMKAFIWTHGEQWADDLAAKYADETEDLIGVPDDDDLI